MPRRRRTAAPVEIVLTEEDLAAIIRETTRGTSPVPSDLPADPPPAVRGFPLAEPSRRSPFADPAFSLGARSPGAVGDAIRMILEATTLDRGRRMGGE